MEEIKLEHKEELNQCEVNLEKFGFSFWGIIKKIEHISEFTHMYVYYFLGIPVYVQLKFIY